MPISIEQYLSTSYQLPIAVDYSFSSLIILLPCLLVLLLIAIKAGFIDWIRMRLSGPREWSESAYLKCLEEHLRSLRWSPQNFVETDFKYKDESFRPLDTSLMLMDPRVDNANIYQKTIKKENDKSRARPIKNLLGEVLYQKQVVILGDPGSGKTITLIKLTNDIIRHSRSLLPKSPLLPIYIPLNEYIEKDRRTGEPQSVEIFIKTEIKKIVGNNRRADVSDRFDALLGEKRFVFMFDAIDEMPRADYYKRFLKLSSFMNANRGNIFVFSCRYLDYIEDLGITKIIIMPFSRRQIRDYLKKYLGKEAKATMNALFMDKRDVAALSSNPFFLSLIAACAKANKDLPSSWVDLVSTFLNDAINEERIRRKFTAEDSEWKEIEDKLLQWLSNLSYMLVENRASGTIIEQNLVTKSLRDLGLSEDLLELAINCGILRRIGGQEDVRFQHHKIQEYFAAIKLASILDEGLGRKDILDDIWWQEVAVMAAGLMEYPDKLILSIISEDHELDKSFTSTRFDFNRLLLALRCLHSAKNKEEQLLCYKNDVSERLLDYLRTGNTLQKVRSLYIAPLIENTEIVDETRELFLHDPSKWVRETALFSLNNMITTTPSLIGTIWGDIFKIDGGYKIYSIKKLLNNMFNQEENIFNIGLSDLPALFSNKETRDVLPIIVLVNIKNTLRYNCIFILLSSVLIILSTYNPLFIPFLAIFISIAILSRMYAFGMMRKGIYQQARLNPANFNRISLMAFILTLAIAIGLVPMYYASIHLSGFIRLPAILLILGLYLIPVYIIISHLSNRDDIVENQMKLDRAVKKFNEQEEKERSFVLSIKPDYSDADKITFARALIAHARKQDFRIHRLQTIQYLFDLLPLNDEEILKDLEDYINKFEQDIEIRDYAWRIYNEIELGIRRGALINPEQLREKMVIQFFEAAGFFVRSLKVVESFECLPDSNKWIGRVNLSEPIFMHCFFGESLNFESVARIHKISKDIGNYDKIFVIIDKTPSNDAWITISALRASGIHFITIDNAIIQHGMERQKEQMILEDRLLKELRVGLNLYDRRDPVSDSSEFFGRESYSEKLLNLLSNGKSIALFGLRKMGKSSMMQYLKAKANFPTAYIDLEGSQELRSLSSLFNRILESWEDSLRTKHSDFIWSPSSLGPNPASGFTEMTHDLIESLRAKGYSPQLGLFLDEIDLIIPPIKGEQANDRSNTLINQSLNYQIFAQTLRSLVQETGAISLLVAGYNPRIVRTDFFDGNQNPFYAFFSEEYIGPLSRDDCIQMIRNIGSQMGLKYRDDAVAFIADMSGGYPMYSRQLCRLIVDKMRESTIKRLGTIQDGIDVNREIFLDQAQLAADYFIRDPGYEYLLEGLWGEVTDQNLWPLQQIEENKAILTMLAGVESLLEKDVVESSLHQRARSHSVFELKRRAVLERQDDRLSIQMKLFQNWISNYNFGRIK